MTNFSFHILMIFVKIQNHKFSEYLNFLSIVIKNLDVLLKKSEKNLLFDSQLYFNDFWLFFSYSLSN